MKKGRVAAVIGITLWLAAAFGQPGAAAANAGPADPPASQSPYSSTNPDLEGRCGIDVALILDASASIRRVGATDLVATAAQTYVDTLENSSSRVAVVNFNSRAAVAANYQPVTETSARPGGSHWLAIHEGAPSGYQLMSSNQTDGRTNWESALTAILEIGTPHLVVMITDGVPTAWLDDAGATVEAPDTATGVTAAAHQADHAAEALRSGGAHLLAIAIGELTADITAINVRDEPSPAFELLARFVEPSHDVSRAATGLYLAGADGEAGTFEASTDDVVVVQEFELLGTRLRELATAMCAVPATPAAPPELADTGPGPTVLIGTIGAGLTLLGGALVTIGRPGPSAVGTVDQSSVRARRRTEGRTQR